MGERCSGALSLEAPANLKYCTPHHTAYVVYRRERAFT